MFDYEGDVIASNDDYRELVAKVIQETFPNALCTVRVRQTKAMRFPLLSVSVDDGPSLTELVNAIPLLDGVKAGARWAYCGKVLPTLGYSVRPRPRGVLARISEEVWGQLKRELPHAWFNASSGRLNPVFTLRHTQEVEARAKKAHPAQSSPTMMLIERGVAVNIVGIAMEQRRVDLDRATPQAKAAGQCLQKARGRKRL